jgi:hypothetical protein
MPGMMTFDSSKAFSNKYPTLTRDAGAEIFRVVAGWDDSPIPIVKDSGFESDTLFCEGIYTVDLDNELFISQYAREDDVWHVELTLSFDALRNLTAEQYVEGCKLSAEKVS